MKMIRPVPITDAILSSSTAPETDYAAWNVGTSYTLGQRVIRTSTHRCYECLVANTGNAPESNLTGTTPKWLDIGPTNRWAMFDGVVGTSTVIASPLTIVLTPGRVNALALLSVEGASLTVTMSSTTGGGTVYSKTLSLLSGVIPFNWFAYFFNPITRVTDVVLTDLPLYADCVLTITITDPTIPVKCGVCVVGTSTDIGRALYGARLGIVDYSKKDTDAFGNTVVIKRRYSRRMSVSLHINTTQVDALASLLAEYRSTPVVWIAAENKFQSMIVFGFYKDFEIEISHPEYSACSLTIEGLT